MKHVLASILNDPDFFQNPVLEADTDALSPGLRPAFCLLQDFFAKLLEHKSKAKVAVCTDDWATAAEFLKIGVPIIKDEWQARSRQDRAFARKQEELAAFPAGPENRLAKAKKIQELFFPEGSTLLKAENRLREEKKLRAARTVTVEQLNPKPITDPAAEILFTSNILVTMPLETESCRPDPQLRHLFEKITSGKQKYWYDHPIPLGIAAEKNEALYGMRGLDRMLAYEKARGLMAAGARATCVLSASTTHDELHAIVKDYFEQEFRANGPWDNLDIFLFSESDCRLLVEQVLQPLARKFFPSKNYQDLFEVFGVDGEYGRHYSFLKAIAAFWQVFIDRRVKATFKIDLDQVFDQQALVRETGKSALEHFTTSLWGARATDNRRRPVYLGMIAGALVNHDDIAKSLFTPDVTYPDQDHLAADELIFHSRLPQALSTSAEMMCRYAGGELDGLKQALQRVHVTGGTNGILIDALRAYRPFTPTVIGRAEDQAYLMSVLFAKKPYLRYAHQAGLIMRHDQQALAGEAARAAAVGKMVGDYVRILQFSFYARALPWPLEETKNMLDPFTGCFVSPIPFTIVYLRFAFKILALIEAGEENRALEFMQLGSRRLLPWVKKLSRGENPLQAGFDKERQAWDLYYDLLDKAEKGLTAHEPEIEKIRQQAVKTVRRCKLNFG